MIPRQEQQSNALPREPSLINSGYQIAAARALLGWTQQDLAKASGLHRRSIQYWERQAVIAHGGFREPIAVRKIRKALAYAGVEVVLKPTIGVRFTHRKPARPIQECASDTN